MINTLKEKAKLLETQTYTLFLACKDSRTPWYAKVFMASVVGYALCPVDLIPDFIPVLGYLDDLIIVPFGIFLALKMIPAQVYHECRLRAESEPINSRAKWVALTFVILIWLLALGLAIKFIVALINR